MGKSGKNDSPPPEPKPEDTASNATPPGDSSPSVPQPEPPTPETPETPKREDDDTWRNRIETGIAELNDKFSRLITSPNAEPVTIVTAKQGESIVSEKPSTPAAPNTPETPDTSPEPTNPPQNAATPAATRTMRRWRRGGN